MTGDAIWPAGWTMTGIFTLLLVFQGKHLLADYFLQPTWLAAKKYLPGWAWVSGLAAHAMVHGLATFIIANVWLRYDRPLLAAGLMFIDFSAHFLMDRVKASPNWLGRYKAVSGKEYVEHLRVLALNEHYPEKRLTDQSAAAARAALDSNTQFWWALGVDQMVHHLTHYYIIWRLVTA